MGNPVTLGSKGGQAAVQEFTGPNGTGSAIAPVGPVVFASDTPTVATVDPSSGLITAVAPGTATITATDQGNGLTDSVLATVALVAGSLVLTVTPLT